MLSPYHWILDVFAFCLLSFEKVTKKKKQKTESALVRTFHKTQRRTFSSRTGTCKTNCLFSILTWNFVAWKSFLFSLWTKVQKNTKFTYCFVHDKWKYVSPESTTNLKVCSGDFEHFAIFALPLDKLMAIIFSLKKKKVLEAKFHSKVLLIVRGRNFQNLDFHIIVQQSTSNNIQTRVNKISFQLKTFNENISRHFFTKKVKNNPYREISKGGRETVYQIGIWGV